MNGYFFGHKTWISFKLRLRSEAQGSCLLGLPPNQSLATYRSDVWSQTWPWLWVLAGYRRGLSFTLSSALTSAGESMPHSSLRLLASCYQGGHARIPARTHAHRHTDTWRELAASQQERSSETTLSVSVTLNAHSTPGNNTHLPGTSNRGLARQSSYSTADKTFKNGDLTMTSAKQVLNHSCCTPVFRLPSTGSLMLGNAY